MIAAAVALPVFSLLVVAPAGPEDGCPSGRQVTEAMQARFPASLLPSDPSASQNRPDVVRTVLDIAADGTVVRFSLIDAHGDTQLRRTLPAPGRGRPASDCVALADTLAAIVERYLGFISYESSDADVPVAGAPADVPAPTTAAPPPMVEAATPPPPARPRSELAMVGLDWRVPSDGRNEPEAWLALGLELNKSTRRIAGVISFGVTPSLSNSFTDASGQSQAATLRRFPARLGALLELAAGPGWVEPSVDLGADLLVISVANGTAPANQFLRLDTGVEATVGYRLSVTRSLFIKPKASIGIMIVRHDILSDGDNGAVVFRTPRAYAAFGIDTGVIFQ